MDDVCQNQSVSSARANLEQRVLFVSMTACSGKVEYCPSLIHSGIVPVPATALPALLQLRLEVTLVTASVQEDGTPKATTM